MSQVQNFCCFFLTSSSAVVFWLHEVGKSVGEQSVNEHLCTARTLRVLAVGCSHWQFCLLPCFDRLVVQLSLCPIAASLQGQSGAGARIPEIRHFSPFLSVVVGFVGGGGAVCRRGGSTSENFPGLAQKVAICLARSPTFFVCLFVARASNSAKKNLKQRACTSRLACRVG